MTEQVLNLGGLSLPLDAVTQTFAILAVRGAGKSNTAAVMAEEMNAAHLPFVVIDPVGSWYGLRARGDGGKGKGLAIPIFGGRHGDVPLERTAGQLLADLVVDQRLTCVLDVSEFSEGDKIRFLIDFAERLYRRNTEPLHLFLEEADDYAPQRPMREQARLLGAWQNIVRRGRARGLGITMITQRSAVLNKDVLTQIETLFVLRTTSPQDRAAIEAWVKYQGGALEMIKTLPTLAAGEAWVWSPSWLQRFERVRMRRRWTFDSGATPKGGKATKPATLADVDLGAIRVQMSATIERAKLEDPKALRAELARREQRIAELQRQLDVRPEPITETKYVPAITPKEREELVTFADRIERIVADVRTAVADGRVVVVGPGTRVSSTGPQTSNPERPAAGKPAVAALRRPPTTSSNGKLSGGERKMLTALAQNPAGRTRSQLAILTGYASSGGGFKNYLGALRSRGLVDGGNEGLRITDAGVAELGAFEPLPSGEALRAHWLEQLSKAERAALEALCAVYPRALSKAELADRAGYEADGGGFKNALGRLRTLELISGRADITASADLFE